MHPLSGITSCTLQAISAIPTHFPYRGFSVCRLSVVCHMSVTFVCPPLKLFHGCRCHLASTLVGFNVTSVKRGSSYTQRSDKLRARGRDCVTVLLATRGKGELRVKHPAKTCNCKLLVPPGEYEWGIYSDFAFTRLLNWSLLHFSTGLYTPLTWCNKIRALAAARDLRSHVTDHRDVSRLQTRKRKTTTKRYKTDCCLHHQQHTHARGEACV